MDPHPQIEDTEFVKARCIATLEPSNGAVFEVPLNAGCSRFIGRFARLPELQGGDGIIRYRDAVWD